MALTCLLVALAPHLELGLCCHVGLTDVPSLQGELEPYIYHEGARGPQMDRYDR